MANEMAPLGVDASANVRLLVRWQGALQGFEWIALLPPSASNQG